MNYKIHIENFLSNNTDPWYLSKDEVYEKSKKKGGFFSNNVWYSHRKYIENNDLKDEVLMGWDLGLSFILFTKSEILVTNYKNDYQSDVTIFPIEKFEFLKYSNKGILSRKISLDGVDISTTSYQENIFKKQYNEISSLLFEERNRIEEEKMRVEREERRKEELIEHEKGQKEILSKVKKIRKEILDDYDKDGNGEIDITECDDLSKILKKNQTKIIEIDRNHIQSFVKISNYLKLQRDNLKIFLKRVMSQKEEDVEGWDWYSRDIEVRSEFDFEEFSSNVEVFKDYVHSYNLLLSSSLSLIVSLTNDDMITFFEIYETLDKLNIFDSNHEKEVKEKLSNIEYGLVKMRDEINVMNNQICNSLEQLSEITLESSNMITNELKSVDSSLKMNNLLQGIQVYQNYKTNRRLK